VTDDAAYRTARALQRAGEWDLALAQLPQTREGAELRAEILTDRHLWRLDPLGEALAAIREIGTDPAGKELGAYLTAQLEYWRRLLKQGGDPLCADPVEALAGLERPRGWVGFWHAVMTDNLREDHAAALTGYLRAREVAQAVGDPLLESYAVRHIGGTAIARGDAAAGIPLLRRSLHLRAACGARPHVAAAAAMLADALGPGDEADELRAIVAVTAEELDLTWLKRKPD
jgi:hypothetical protein